MASPSRSQGIRAFAANIISRFLSDEQVATPRWSASAQQ